MTALQAHPGAHAGQPGGHSLRTTYSMVQDAQSAMLVAEELVEATGCLLADAVINGDDLTLFVTTYKRAKAQRALAAAVYDGTMTDWHRDREAVSA